jgi:hypothetical protein
MESIWEGQKPSLSHFWKYFIVIIFVVVAIVAAAFVDFSSEVFEKIPTCGDSSFYDTCSLSKPYFCSGGILVSNASACGCPKGFSKGGDECLSDFYNGSEKVVSLNYLLGGNPGQINYTLYSGVLDYLFSLPLSLIYLKGEIPRRVDFKLKKIDNSLQKDALRPLVVDIQNLAPNSKQDQARIAVSLVQNIQYKESNFEEVFGGKASIRVARYPYEVLYEGLGSCEGKSELLAYLLREIGYGVVLFYYQDENHEAVGIKCPLEKSYLGSGYCFVETTMPAPISYSEGSYLGVNGPQKLLSEPEIVLISEGISLGEGLEDYDDADDLAKIMNKVDSGKEINYFEKKKLDKLRVKYGLNY